MIEHSESLMSVTPWLSDSELWAVRLSACHRDSLAQFGRPGHWDDGIDQKFS
jgi:hypothetical protein